MNDLDTRLERLAAEATRDAVPPELTTVARRGRRRRWRQLAGSVLLVAAVVAGGLVLPARLAGRSTPAADDGPPAAGTDVSGAGMLTGYWFGKADASVFLSQGIDPAERRAVRERIEAVDAVDEVFYETRQEAYDRFKHQFRSRPEMLDRVEPTALPESFRVRLDDPDHFKQLYFALCRPGKTAEGKPRCMDGVDSVVEQRATLKPLLVFSKWERTTDLTILLDHDITDARRLALQARLAAIPGVAEVRYESRADAFRALPGKLHSDPNVLPKLTPEVMPTSFRVALHDPTRVREFHRALCGSRRTGDCPDGITGILEHPRKR